MKQNCVQKTTKTILTIALVMQIIYFLNISFVIWRGENIVGILSAYDYYYTPYNIILLIWALINTLLFILIYVVLTHKMSKQKYVGIGTGIWLGIYTYTTYYFINNVIGAIYSNLVRTNIEYSQDIELAYALNTSDVIRFCCSCADIWVFTALILLLIAYSIYGFDCRSKKEQRDSDLTDK